jgi:peptide/nickel transport system substrate-binding protein
MTPRSKALVALAAAGALGLAACSSSGNKTPPSNNAGKPVFGGTLKVVASGGPDHFDTVPAYYTADYIMERAYARQLLSYPSIPDPTISSPGWKADITPVPDVAAAMPTVTNGGKTYTFHLKTNVFWSTTPKRAVVSTDFLREYKAFCNPVAPVGNDLYFVDTIAGLKQYCAQETAYFANAKKHPPTAANIANFQNSHSISGILTPNPTTIVFNLLAPAADFPEIVSMPFTSARPVEYDSYVPDSLPMRQHLISDGPYTLKSYVPGKSIIFVKNPAWSQASDTLRHQYVNEIDVTIGISDATTILTDEKAGTYDFADDVSVQPSAIQSLVSSHDPMYWGWPGDATNPYVVFNLRSPNNNHAMANLKLRQAIEYGINKVAIQKVLGGPIVNKIINTAIPPGNVGYVPFNQYPTPGNQGSVSKCKALLAASGHPHGINLTYLSLNDSISVSVAQSVAASLAPCGIHIKDKAEAGSSFFVDIGNSPNNNKPGTYDLAQAGWFPDWFGNNGRTVIAPLFQTNCVVNTNNYGCFNSAKLDSLIKQAEGASNLSAAAGFWHQADELVMKNAVIVPLNDPQNVFYTSARLGYAGSTAIPFVPNIGGPDMTNLWIKK